MPLTLNGNSIRIKREALGMSRRDLAYICGETEDIIQKFEEGEARFYSIDIASRIAKALKAKLIYDSDTDQFKLKGGDPKHVILRKRVQSPCSRHQKHGKDGAQDRRDKGRI